MRRRWGAFTVVLAGLSSGSVTVGVLLLDGASAALALVTALPVAVAGAVATGLWLWPTFGDQPESASEPALEADADWFGDLGAHVHHAREPHIHMRRVQ